MGAILPAVSTGVFEPNDVEAMSLAYGEVCNALHIDGNARAREAIAVRVIELTQRGERCPTVLRDRVLAEANTGTGGYCGLALFRAGSSPRRRSWWTIAALLGKRFHESKLSTAASTSADNTT